MNIQELRIGNYFLDDNNCISKLTGMSPFGHSTRCDEPEGCELLLDFYDKTNKDWRKDYTCDSNSCNPIELTEDILLKCGFEKIDHIHGYSFYSLSKSKTNKCHLDIYDTNTKYYGYMTNHIKYLHELQNAFKVFTGKELEITI